MSLILEALKKLEREKETPARGVVVVGATPWSGARPERRFGLFVLGLAFGASLIALARWRQGPAERTLPAPVPAAPTTAAAPARELELLPPTLASAALPRPAPTTSATTLKPAPTFTLQAISERDGRAVAIVNDRLVREGDSIDGARIVRIAKDEVELEVGGRPVLLRF